MESINLQSSQEWGWELKSGKLLPVYTNLSPAHPSLLEVIRCSCKAGCSTQDAPAIRMAWTALLLAERAKE